jgi:predicted nucleic acid-binding protein
MDAYYFDTSALAKRYVKETGSAWVTGICDPATGNALYIARITEVEVTSALARRRKAKTLSVAHAGILLTAFQNHLTNEYAIVEITPPILSAAVRLADLHSLRALDATQLAALMEVNIQRQAQKLPLLTLVSADDELNTAASAEGISVENPNAHP